MENARMIRGHLPARFPRRVLAVAAATSVIAGGGVLASSAATAAPRSQTVSFSFKLTPAAGITKCLPHASGKVKIVPNEAGDVMTVSISGVPSGHYALFDLQTPTKPFGVSTFLTYISTGKKGGTATVRGIFDSRTFSLSPGGSSATFGPAHEYHLGIWFNNPQTPFKAGCEPGATKPTVTPFNGTHNAGILVLGTAQFPASLGPLAHLVR
jgi:hypothetical protein